MEFGSDYIIRPIQASDSLNSFKTGSQELQPLKAFLRNQAVDVISKQSDVEFSKVLKKCKKKKKKP